MVRMNLNNKLNGIELVFDSKPTQEVLTEVKAAGFRWHNVKKLWYAKQTTERIALAEKLTGGAIAPVKEVKTNKKLASLWERVQVADIPEHDKRLSTKEIAEQTRKHIKERFPEIKFSCRIGSGGWAACNEVKFYFKSAPFSKDSEYYEFIYEYVKAWLWSFNYDNSDSMTDYFDRGFYEHIGTWDYEEVEPTEEQRADMADFDEKKAAADKAAEEKAHAEYLTYMAEREEAAKLAEIRRAEEEKKHNEIIEAVKVIELSENEKYIIAGKMVCGLGKDNNLNDVIEYGKEKEETAIIKRELHFKSIEMYQDFCKLFMYDFDFLQGCGGTGTLDARVTNDNYMKLNQEQRNAVKWVLWDCVAVYVNNVLMLVIDPEGYSYARYVNIVNGTYTKTLLHQVEKIEAETVREEFYMPSPIAEQAQELKEGEQYTIVSVDPWTMYASMHYVTITKVNIKDYAQYKNSLYIEYIEKGKRKSKYSYYHNNNSVLIYKGYMPAVPESITKKQINNNMYEVMNAGTNVKNFMVNVCKYYKEQDIEAIVNTLQY